MSYAMERYLENGGAEEPVVWYAHHAAMNTRLLRKYFSLWYTHHETMQFLCSEQASPRVNECIIEHSEKLKK